ncbi:MAG: hypothetical protein QF535_23150, partial [Anaerolineales bacterium]|nr:hypothetical protein [Anaerolineales bacterium]
SITSAQVSHPASEITAGTFGAGDYTITNTGEVFLSISNTEAGGHDYRLVSAGSVGGIGLGGFSIYDSTVGQSRLTIDSNGNVNIGGNLNLQNNRITNVADPIVAGDVATKSYVDARVVSVLGGDGDGDGVVGVMDCNDGNEDVWQNLIGYADVDGDGRYRATSPETVCSGSSLPSSYSASPGNDCDDNCPTCYPGSTSYTTSTDGKDQDCDGTNDENIAPPTRTCSHDPAIPVCYSGLNSACSDYCGGTLSGGFGGPAGHNYGFYSFSSCSGTGTLSCHARNIGSGSNAITCSCTPHYQ